MTMPKPTATAIAANRFGLGARPGELAGIGADAAGWLLRQLKGAPPVLKGEGLKPSADTLAKAIELRKDKKEATDERASENQKKAAVLKLPAIYRPVYIDEIHARVLRSRDIAVLNVIR